MKNEPNLQLLAAQNICRNTTISNDIYEWSIKFNVDLIKHEKTFQESENYIDLLSDVRNDNLYFVKHIVK